MKSDHFKSERSHPDRTASVTLDAKAMQMLAANHDEAFRLIEDRFGVRLAARGGDVIVSAEPVAAGGDANGEDERERERIDAAAGLLRQLAELNGQGVELRRKDLLTAVGLVERHPEAKLTEHFLDARISFPGRKDVIPKSENQRAYIAAVQKHDLVFGIGPAGTGKTYLAVAVAASMLLAKRVKRIVLARPAVEAGESLGFLPGDLAAKVDPYLRPLYDALYDMLEPDRTEQLLEEGTIEIAPLAYMRGRTLDQAFLILDEAQNTTSEQMKMFLTRIGNGSKAVVTGDVTQIDLPPRKTSGLVEARRIIDGVDGVSFNTFDAGDVVRHPLVQRIIHAYDRHHERVSKRRTEDRQSAPTAGDSATDAADSAPTPSRTTP